MSLSEICGFPTSFHAHMVWTSPKTRQIFTAIRVSVKRDFPSFPLPVTTNLPDRKWGEISNRNTGYLFPSVCLLQISLHFLSGVIVVTRRVSEAKSNRAPNNSRNPTLIFIFHSQSQMSKGFGWTYTLKRTNWYADHWQTSQKNKRPNTQGTLTKM